MQSATESAARSVGLEDAEIDLVRLLYVGNDGVVRGHTVDAADVENAVTDGATLPQSVQSLTAFDQRILDGRFDAVGEVRLMPDPDTFREQPHADGCGAMLCDIHDLDGGPWAADPRSSLTAFLEGMDADVRTAFESEYHLCRETEDGLVPLDQRGVYSTESMRAAHPITTDIVDALKAQAIGFEKYYPEHAPGKHEVVIAPATGVRAADEHVFLKETVKGVAANHDVQATFLPRPFPDSTNGCHIHLSLWDGDDNVFYDASDADGLSERARHFIGGVLEHADALVALTAPTVNSYARLRPQTEASAFACWGLDNREAAVRIPSPKGDAEKTTRLEFRPADNAANPYLALLGLLAAGMDGVERGLGPGEPVAYDPGNLPPAERDERDVRRLPETLGEAVRALEADDVLADALGDDLHESYIEVKRTQWRAFTESADEWKLDRFREVF